MTSRVSRRAFLRTAALASAAASLYACGDGKRGPSARLGPTPGASPGAAPAPGGILRTYGFEALAPQTFDPHLARGGAIVDLHAAVFSKLYRYADELAGVIEPDLAAAMPEQPDDLTCIVRLRQDVRFHDSPALQAAHAATAGRTLDSSDVKYSIERQTDASSLQAARFLRSGQLRVIDRIETPDRQTLVLHLKEPAAPLVAFLAGRQSFIVARETVDPASNEMSAGAMLGSGPYVLDSFEPGVVARFRRNVAWHGSSAGSPTDPTRPYLDGIDAFLSPQQDLFQRAAVERQLVDLAPLVDPEELARARTTNLADIAIDETYAGRVLASRLLLDRPPFKDDRVRRAIHLALDRRRLVELLYPPFDGRASASISGPIASAMERWAMPEEDLVRLPGYEEDKVEALTEARQLITAALADGALDDVPAIVAGVPQLLAERAPDWLQRQLRDVLNLTLLPVIDPSGDALLGAGLQRNFEGAAEGVVSFTLAFEDGGVDLDDWVQEFRSGHAANSYRLQDATLDGMIDAQRREFDGDRRRKLGRDIQQYLVGKVNARIDYLAPVQRRLRWGYVNGASFPLSYGDPGRLIGTWLDRSHSRWASRPV